MARAMPAPHSPKQFVLWRRMLFEGRVERVLEVGRKVNVDVDEGCCGMVTVFICFLGLLRSWVMVGNGRLVLSVLARDVVVISM